MGSGLPPTNNSSPVIKGGLLALNGGSAQRIAPPVREHGPLQTWMRTFGMHIMRALVPMRRVFLSS